MLPEDTFTSLNRPAERPAFPFHQRHIHGPSADEGSKRLARWSLLLALILAVWCGVLVIEAVSSLLPDLEKSLPVAQSSPNLNLGQGEVPFPRFAPAERARTEEEPRLPASVEIVPVESLPRVLFDEPPLLPEVAKIEVPALPALPEPSRIEVPVPPEPVVNVFAEPPLLMVEARAEEPIDLAYLVGPDRPQHLGETPMTRTWKLLSASTVVAAALAIPAPALAQEDLKTVLEKLDKMEKSIKDSFSKAAKDIADLRVDVTGLQSESVTQRSEHGKTKMQVEKIESMLSKLQADVDALRRKLETPALYPPTDQFNEIKKQLTHIEQAIKGGTHVAKTGGFAAVGRLMLVNMYPEDMLFIVNQRNIRVRPGEMMPLDGVPAGMISYEVVSPTWGLRARNTTPLAANETLTLTAR